jgi:hypothetical protein
LRTAAHTFARKSDASRWLTFKEAEIRSGDWIDPDASGVLFGDYAEQWIRDRVLMVRTEELYRGLLRDHLLSVSATSASATLTRQPSVAGARNGSGPGRLPPGRSGWSW